jgi:L-methionine (R)-S-oxide reductase
MNDRSTRPGREPLPLDPAEKVATYEKVRTQLQGLIADQTDFLANISNFAALLFTTLPRLNWTGFYLLRGNDLVLGPFQGKPACSCIAVGNGVCGTAALERAAILVPDVHAFPGHIVCDEASQSEIVVPMFKDGHLIGVLDMDSPVFDRFDETDRQQLERLLQQLMDGTEVPQYRLEPPAAS